MTTHVLVPIDNSDHAAQALEFAIETYGDATLTAVHVLDPADFYAATGLEMGAMANYEQVLESHRRRSAELLERAAKQAGEAGVELETDEVIGNVPRSIVEYVEEHDVDHVVIGSHGRTGASRLLLGSVAETVARRSPVPVTIVR
ncbi:universal stress protein [Natronobiforma cellulositropha]|uniref:universal stress protein n=1 Tax=Natronobiforma cellulositropha TaxID=1679076 RepID=UPI0021D5B60C|nr:universal stress protein [Natronobiforma cellulositropha]